METHHRSSLEDPGAELIDRVTGLWDQYGRIALGVIAALAVIIAGAWFMLRANERRENEASGKLAEASTQFWQGNYQVSLKAAQDVAKQYSSTPSGQLAHVVAGDNDYWTGDWKAAIDEYRAYLAKNPTGLVSQTVRRSLAYSLESDGQPAEAVKLYDGLVGAFDRESSAEFLMGAARCLIAEGHPDQALVRVQRLLKDYGETSFASRARVMAAELSPPKPV